MKESSGIFISNTPPSNRAFSRHFLRKSDHPLLLAFILRQACFKNDDKNWILAMGYRCGRTIISLSQKVAS